MAKALRPNRRPGVLAGELKACAAAGSQPSVRALPAVPELIRRRSAPARGAPATVYRAAPHRAGRGSACCPAKDRRLRRTKTPGCGKTIRLSSRPENAVQPAPSLPHLPHLKHTRQRFRRNHPGGPHLSRSSAPPSPRGKPGCLSANHGTVPNTPAGQQPANAA